MCLLTNVKRSWCIMDMCRRSKHSFLGTICSIYKALTGSSCPHSMGGLQLPFVVPNECKTQFFYWISQGEGLLNERS